MVPVVLADEDTPKIVSLENLAIPPFGCLVRLEEGLSLYIECVTAAEDRSIYQGKCDEPSFW